VFLIKHLAFFFALALLASVDAKLAASVLVVVMVNEDSRDSERVRDLNNVGLV
jgi:hypothetical protein